VDRFVTTPAGGVVARLATLFGSRGSIGGNRALTCALALGLVVAASGCLDFSDNNGPIMSIELFWDERPDTAAFVGGTCESAGVSTMNWTLLDAQNRNVASANQPCTNAIDVHDPKPGTYRLKITGQDADGNDVWRASCTGLNVLRFDVGYECDICDVDNPAACK
jgi:hypothetical protein